MSSDFYFRNKINLLLFIFFFILIDKMSIILFVISACKVFLFFVENIFLNIYGKLAFVNFNMPKKMGNFIFLI